MLNVKPLPPDAVAVMLPLLAPGAEGLTTVPETVTVTPAHGSVGGFVPPPLLHA